MNNTAIVKDFIVVGREDENEGQSGMILNEPPVPNRGVHQLPLGDTG